MFMLTLLGQSDTTLGFPSGTASAILAVFVYNSFNNLYQRIRPIHHKNLHEEEKPPNKAWS